MGECWPLPNATLGDSGEVIRFLLKGAEGELAGEDRLACAATLFSAFGGTTRDAHTGTAALFASTLGDILLTADALCESVPLREVRLLAEAEDGS